MFDLIKWTLGQEKEIVEENKTTTENEDSKPACVYVLKFESCTFYHRYIVVAVETFWMAKKKNEENKTVQAKHMWVSLSLLQITSKIFSFNKNISTDMKSIEKMLDDMTHIT